MFEENSYTEAQVCKMSSTGDLILGDKLMNNLSTWVDYYANIEFNMGCYFTKIDGQNLLIESEDCPLVAKAVRKSDDTLLVEVYPGINFKVDLSSFKCDDFDNFYALSLDKKIPVFFTQAAQNDFFNLCTSFSDDNFEVFGKTYDLPFLYTENHSETPDFWSQLYDAEKTGWDLDKPHPFLDTICAQLKLMKSRVLVLGAGKSHDANFFAQQGHLVTAIDMSSSAIDKAKKLYPETDRLKYVQADVFDFGESGLKFDIIWDHTFYCAIPPFSRNKLVRLWDKILEDDGKLLGVFFSMFKLEGPPYGGSEGELQQRIHGTFSSLYWNRIRQGDKSRLGKEFFACLEKTRK